VVRKPDGLLPHPEDEPVHGVDGQSDTEHDGNDGDEHPKSLRLLHPVSTARGTLGGAPPSTVTYGGRVVGTTYVGLAGKRGYRPARGPSIVEATMEGVRSMAFGWVQAIAAIIGSRRIDDDRGAVAAEYGLLLGLIALVIIIAVTAFGIAVTGLFQEGADAF
jgi:pilus assembly protein Flp/PilA